MHFHLFCIKIKEGKNAVITETTSQDSRATNNTLPTGGSLVASVLKPMGMRESLVNGFK